MTWLTVTEYLCQKWPRIYSTLSEHLSSPPAFSGVRVARSLVLCVDRCLSFFFWLLYCLSFFDWQILITSLVSSNSSYQSYWIQRYKNIKVIYIILDIRRFLSILFRPFQLLLNYLTFQSFDYDFERPWWALFQKRVKHTTLDIQV